LNFRSFGTAQDRFQFQCCRTNLGDLTVHISIPSIRQTQGSSFHVPFGASLSKGNLPIGIVEL
jgi:hypothetical protein